MMPHISQLVSEYVEFWYNLKRYLVKRSDIDNNEKILMLPDGTAFVGQIRIEITDKHGNPLGIHRLTMFGSDPFYETYGFVPPTKIVRAVPAEPNKSKQELYQVCLSYHPSGDHMDSRSDIVENYFTLSTSASEASNKVLETLKSKRGSVGCYEHSAVWKGLPDDITPKQAISVLKTAGLRVVE